MDPKQNTDVPLTPQPVNLQNEIAHITQEMYKKNLELAQINRTLTLLRRIDEVILSTVTDKYQIGQQVANLIAANEEYKIVMIFLIDKEKNTLSRLSVSQNELVQKIESTIPNVFHGQDDSIILEDSIIANVISSKKMQASNDLHTVLQPHMTVQQAQLIASTYNINTNLIYPLVVRGNVLGIIVLCLAELAENLSAQTKDLSDRLADVIGIALDNALLYQRIEEANERLKQLDQLKDEFVSLASHELRTPMTIIKSYLWLLLQQKKGPINDQQKHDLERSFSSTERLINLVNDMLNVSRIESGRMTVEIQTIDILELVQTTVSEMQARAQELGITLTVSNNNKSIPSVKADPEKVKQVLINLIGNSLKFTPREGSIQISVMNVIDKGMVNIEVQDTGKGIKAEDMPKLFQKFGLIGNNYLTKQGVQGTGLGLYLSKSLIELMGGTLWVQSDGENKGSTFTFSLRPA